MARKGSCLECGTGFEAKRATKLFCSPGCRQIWNNRRMLRGAEIYDLFMAMRFDRQAAEAEGVWNFMCRMAASFKAHDDRDREGRRSFDTIRNVKDRNGHLASTVVAVDYVAGFKRS